MYVSYILSGIYYTVEFKPPGGSLYRLAGGLFFLAARLAAGQIFSATCQDPARILGSLPATCPQSWQAAAESGQAAKKIYPAAKPAAKKICLAARIKGG